jgi:dolichol-phosphate mannosyltransferase
MYLSIVIPCYNESQNIPLIIGQINSSSLLKDKTEIIFVDNGSTDETPMMLKKALLELSSYNIRSIRIEKNIGYGNGIKEGIAVSTGEVISWTHADLQTDINDIYIGYKKITRLVTTDFFLKGRRKRRSPLDSMLTLGMGVLSSILLRQRLTDINAQPKMFHRSFLKFVKDPPLDFSFDLYFYYTAKKERYNIIDIPVSFRKRKFGEAKGGGGSSYMTRIKIIKRTIRYIFNLRSIIYQQKK